MTRLAIVPGAVSASSLRALVLTRDARAHPQLSLSAEGQAAIPLPAHTQPAPAPPAIAPILGALNTRAYRVHAEGLRPDTRYTLAATAGGSAARVLLRTLPARLPDAGFTLAFASCHYRGFPLHARIAAALRSARLELPPAALLMLGDNLYLDVPSPTGTAFEVVQRYVDHLFDPNYLGVRALLPTFATWDDHEFWNDYPEPQPQLPFTRDAALRTAHRDAALACLDFFQTCNNPERVQPRGRSYTFALPPLRFFVADTRTQRTRAGVPAPAMLHPDDLAQLETFLTNADGPCVVCLGQPLWMAAKSSAFIFTTDHNPPFFREQYARIWSALRNAQYDVLVLSGDLHYSRLLRIAPGTQAQNRMVWECVSSPLCHIPRALGSAQATSAISDPARVPELPLARAEYQFGTSANASFGLINFRRATGQQVRVGVAFIDARSGRPAAPVQRTALGPLRPATLRECRQPSAFELRMR